MRKYASSWRRMRAKKAFAGFTLSTFDEDVIRPAHDARDEVSRLEARLRAAMARREAADGTAMGADEADILGRARGS